MPITYGSGRLTPAPIANITKTYKRLGDTKKVKPVYNIVLDGWIIANMGSPIAISGSENHIIFQTSGGVNTYPADTVSWSIPSDGQSLVVLKQNAIRELFSQDYQQLNIQPWNSNQPLYCFPRVLSIEFPEDLWYKLSKYKITLEADQVFGPSQDASPTEDTGTADSGNMDIHQAFDFISQYNLEDATETYSIEMDTEIYGIFKCSHNISAKGYRTLNSVGTVIKEAWDNARTWVNSRTGFDPYYFQSGTFGITGGFSNYNHFKTQNTDINNGTFGITETWILSSGNYYEDYSAEVKQSINDPYKSVTVQGTINGLSSFRVGVDTWEATGALLKYNSASGAWYNTISGNLYIRAQNQIGIPLNPAPVSQVVTHNFIKGIISYNFELNNRPNPIISGAISEKWDITDTNPSGLVNSIGVHQVFGRALGPVLQSIGTTTETKRSISCEIVMQAPTYPSGNSVSALMALKPREPVNQLISGLTPTNYISGYLFVTRDEEVWSPLQMRYSRQWEWTYNRQT